MFHLGWCSITSSTLHSNPPWRLSIFKFKSSKLVWLLRASMNCPMSVDGISAESGTKFNCFDFYQFLVKHFSFIFKLIYLPFALIFALFGIESIGTDTFGWCRFTLKFCWNMVKYLRLLQKEFKDSKLNLSVPRLYIVVAIASSIGFVAVVHKFEPSIEHWL